MKASDSRLLSCLLFGVFACYETRRNSRLTVGVIQKFKINTTDALHSPYKSPLTSTYSVCHCKQISTQNSELFSARIGIYNIPGFKRIIQNTQYSYNQFHIWGSAFASDLPKMKESVKGENNTSV
jgi:hypothetical protein